MAHDECQVRDLSVALYRVYAPLCAICVPFLTTWNHIFPVLSFTQVNVTHAALDVVLRALRDYKTIGGGSSSKPGADDSVGTMTRSSGSPRLSPTASATNFAARDGGGREGVADRGIENLGVVAQQQQQKQQQQKQQQQRYSPFVLQNRTGLQLEFWAHQDKVDRYVRAVPRVLAVAGRTGLSKFEGASIPKGEFWRQNVVLLRTCSSHVFSAAQASC